MSSKHSPRKVTLAMIKGKSITTSVPVIHYHASDDELEEIYPSTDEEKRSTPEFERISSKVTSIPSNISENNSETRSVCTENVPLEGTPPSLHPWKVLSEIKGKITKTFEEKLSEIKSDRRKRCHSRAESSSISDLEDLGNVLPCDEKIDERQSSDSPKMTDRRRGNSTGYVGFSGVKTGLKDKNLQDECVESGVEASEFSQEVSENVQADYTTRGIPSSTRIPNQDNFNTLGQHVYTRSSDTFPKKTNLKSMFSRSIERLICQGMYQFFTALIAILCIYYVIPLPEYLLGFTMGVFITVTIYDMVTKAKKVLTTLPDERYVSSPTIPVLEIPAVEEHAVVERFQGWLNELPYNYEPNNYHVARTKSVFFRLEGTILRIMETRIKVPKKAVWDEPKHKQKFVRKRAYNLTGAKVELLPHGLARRRRWSKKYPICITVKKGALICNVTLRSSTNGECSMNDWHRDMVPSKGRVIKYKSGRESGEKKWGEEQSNEDEIWLVNAEGDESMVKREYCEQEGDEDIGEDDNYYRSYNYDLASDNVRNKRAKYDEKDFLVSEEMEEYVKKKVKKKNGNSCKEQRKEIEEKEEEEEEEEKEEEEEEDEEDDEEDDEGGSSAVDRLRGNARKIKRASTVEKRRRQRRKEATNERKIGKKWEEEEEGEEKEEEQQQRRIEKREHEEEDEEEEELEEEEEKEGEEDEMQNEDEDGNVEQEVEEMEEKETYEREEVGEGKKDAVRVGEEEAEKEEAGDKAVTVKMSSDNDRREGFGSSEVGRKGKGRKGEKSRLSEKRKKGRKTKSDVARLKKLKNAYGKKYVSKKDEWKNELKIFVFARSDREKEDWYRRLVSAASRYVKNEDYLLFTINASTDTSNAAQSSTVQRSTVTIGESRSSFSTSNSHENVPELNYNAYMAKYLDTGGYLTTTESGFPASAENTLWINCLIARILFDVRKCPETISLIQDKIQRKLSNIKLPYFMECLLVSEVTIGQGAPVIRNVTKPVSNERGLWLDLDVTYKGSLTMTVETKLNLMKLTRTGSVPSSTSVVIPSEKHGELVTRSPIFDSDLEDTPETSTEDDYDTSGTQSCNTVKEATSTQSSGKKFLNMVDRIAANKYFQHATELYYVRRAMEGVSNTEIRLMVTVSSIEGCLSVNIPPAPSDRLWYGFKPVPKVSLAVKPAVGERTVNIVYVTKWIETKLLREFEKLVVLPNMDDLVVPFCPNYPYTTIR